MNMTYLLATDVYITSSSEQLISININIFTLGDYIMNNVNNWDEPEQAPH